MAGFNLITEVQDANPPQHGFLPAPRPWGQGVEASWLGKATGTATPKSGGALLVDFIRIGLSI
jgi:hypothetical protein